MKDQWNHKIFNAGTENFEELALEIFRFQYRFNPVYGEYVNMLNRDPAAVKKITDIPFLPIEFFKTHQVVSTPFEPVIIFESSGTTGAARSRHFVKEPGYYEESFLRGFQRNYGPVTDWCILGLLPAYLENKNSSLVYMVDQLIKKSGHPQSNFYLHNFEKLAATVHELEKTRQKTLLLGVSYALLDFAEKFPAQLKNTVVMETGGMKGRREEMIRSELHDRLSKSFGLSRIHSEYGMTELLSQAYSQGEGIFTCPPWLKIMIRDEDDPLMVRLTGNGAINIIDLANIFSCSFIATSDVGKLYDDGSFEITGRMDNSDLRGCSLLVV